MKTRVIQDDPDDQGSPEEVDPAENPLTPEGPRAAAARARPRASPLRPEESKLNRKDHLMSSLTSWTREHRFVAFFVLAYLLTWSTWPVQAAGIISEPLIVATGALIAALIIIAVTEGRPGWRDPGSRVIRWRVPWYWYVVAVGLPLAVRLVATEVNVGFGATGPEWADLSWSSFAAVFALRLVNPTEAPVSEEPSFPVGDSRSGHRFDFDVERGRGFDAFWLWSAHEERADIPEARKKGKWT